MPQLLPWANPMKPFTISNPNRALSLPSRSSFSVDPSNANCRRMSSPLSRRLLHRRQDPMNLGESPSYKTQWFWARAPPSLIFTTAATRTIVIVLLPSPTDGKSQGSTPTRASSSNQLRHWSEIQHLRSRVSAITDHHRCPDVIINFVLQCRSAGGGKDLRPHPYSLARVMRREEGNRCNE